MFNKDEYVYCTNCKNFSIGENENPQCSFENECDLWDCEDGRRFVERPKYEPVEQTVELGNLLFGHSRGKFSFPDRDLVDSEEWNNLLEITNSDSYGYSSEWDHPICNVNDRGGYENAVFVINPYWWGNEDNEVECEKPNFMYKPSEFEIRWYKYPFRDSYMNIDLPEDKIKAIWSECIKSVKN